MASSTATEWFQHQLDTSDSAAVKRQYLQWHAEQSGTPCSSGDDLLCVSAIEAWMLPELLWRGRLISLDERTLWACLGPALVADRVHHVIDPWNEQLAIKVAHYFLQSRSSPSPSSTADVGSEETWKSLRKELDDYATAAIKPQGTSTVSDYIPLSTTAPSSSGSCSGSAPAEWSDKVAFLPMEAGNDFSEGSLRCAAPVSSFGVLLEVPRCEMFFRDTLLQHCALGRAIAAAPALRDLLSNEEAMLVMALTYERFVVGPSASHWQRLLSQCPASYPTIPTTWTLGDLAELDGLDMLDDVLAKRTQLQTVADQLDTTLVPIFHELLLLQAREDAHTSSGTSTAVPSESELRAAFCRDHLAWAQSTFDSRAFNLNVDGTVVMALVPLADMINHTNRTDVLIRRVEPGGGPFVMQVGAALTPRDVGRELWMSYGPLQNWELLQHYGFVLGIENEHDTLPFPLSLPDLSETMTAGGETGDEEDWDARRCRLLRRYALCLPGRCWVGYDGVPAPALLAVLRVQLAQAEEFAAMESRPFGPFVPLSPATEAAVVATVATTVRCVLEVFPTTLSEDEEILSELRAPPADDEDHDSDDAEAVYNYTLCVQLRTGLKRIASRTLEWCRQHT